MAEEQTRKFDIPWGTLLPLLGVIAGVIAQIPPLTSPRPPVANEKPLPVIAKQDVDARLWQDPIAVAEKQNVLLEADIQAKRVTQDQSDRHRIKSLGQLLDDRVQRFNQNVLLLAVMLDAGPYSEQAELRLRTRQAVLEGLSESGFVPIDGEHIGFVTATWPPTPPPPSVPRALLLPWEEPTPPPPSVPRALLLPWEECESIEGARRVFPSNTKRVFVLWLPAVNFNNDPLSCFGGLIDELELKPETRDKITIRLIGPANSTGLQNMIREVRWNHPKGLSEQTQKALDGVCIISPLATASDCALLSSTAGDSGEKEKPDPCSGKLVTQCLEAALPNPSGDPRHGLHFVRTVATDETVLRELIKELKRRRIVAGVPARQPILAQAHIVVLSEWDTYYGRTLSSTFAHLASHPTETNCDPRVMSAGAQGDSSDTLPSIHSYYYMRGIDGQLPGDVTKETQHDTAQKNQLGQESVPIDATEGLNHSDYLRRLARELKENNVRWQQTDGFGIRAIGLLGSDIYDKLMILRALRPEFRDVVFFTNNYDAHFERRDVWGDARNLVIGSPFKGVLPETFEHRPVAPFRDTNQTAMYEGTLVATTRMEGFVASDYLAWQPRIFEIGRHGACDLSAPWYLKGEYLSARTQNWFRDWLFPKWDEEERRLTSGPNAKQNPSLFLSAVVWQSPVFWRLLIAAFALLAIAGWISITVASRTLTGGGTTLQRFGRLPGSTTFWVVCGVPLIVFGVAMFAQCRSADIVQYADGAQEPLAFFSGISIWPSEMLRLIALMLAIHFMFKAKSDLSTNVNTLNERFRFAALPPSADYRLKNLRWADLGIGRMEWSHPGTLFSAEEAWHAYLRRSGRWPRFIRIAVLFSLYFLFSVFIYSLFPPAPAPARGELAFQFDKAVILLAAIGIMILTFYVVDAIQLNTNFIRMFIREITRWRGSEESQHRSPPLTEEELSAYHEISFVAQRTEVVAPLIWYPLIVLTLIFVARSSFFDNWTWPASLKIIFALNAAWPIGSAVMLRRTAERLRNAALANLRLSRLKDRASQARREILDELINEIDKLKKGAFAPLTEQPFIHAVLVPSGGLGLLALGQRLWDMF